MSTTMTKPMSSKMSTNKIADIKLRDAVPTMAKPAWLEESQFAFMDMSLQIPPTIDFNDVLKPGFWANVANTFQKNSISQSEKHGAIIHVRTNDHAYYAILYVRAVLSNGLIVQCVGPAVDKNGKPCPVNLQTGQAWSTEGLQEQIKRLAGVDFELKWNESKSGFDIVRPSDRIIISGAENHKTRESALEFVKQLVGIEKV